MNVDEALAELIAGHRLAAMDTAARAAVSVGGSVWLLASLAVVGLVVLVLTRQWLPGAAAAVAFVAASALVGLVKPWIARPRPSAAVGLVHVGGWAMPSGHAAWMAAVAVAGFWTFAWPTPRARRWCGLVLALAVAGLGLCMVYLGVHWLTDVIAGWAVGGAVGGAVGAGCSRLPSVRRRAERS